MQLKHTPTLLLEALETRLNLSTIPAIPRFDHVVVVIEENRAFGEVMGSSAAPYINSLAKQGANFTKSYAIEHPSQPNYLDLFSGSNQGVTDDNMPSGKFSAANLGGELLKAGNSFTTYSEDLPSVGFNGDTSGAYARKHNPAANFSDVPASANQPFSAFPSDYTKLPTVSYVIPNLNNDMHDGTIQQGDTWLKNNIDAYAQWAKTHNSLLMVTFDEDDSSANNQIPTVFAGANVTPGQYSENVDHFSMLRTMEDMYGLAPTGAAASATPITDVWSGSTTTTTAPAAPSNLAATAASSSQIKLTWTDNATNETGFKLERSTDGTTFTQIAAPAAGATSYTDSSLSASTKYYYRVRATNTVGDSAYSGVANATTAATTTATAPAAPSNLAATAASSSQIKLTWTDNATNETGFKVERSTDGTTFTQVAAPAAGATSYTDSSLSASTKYYYRVRATNAVGDSAYSGVANATTQAATTTSNSVYVSDLTPASATNGWGPVEKNMSNGEDLAGDGHTLTLNGVTYAKGLGVHAPSDVAYTLNGGYSSFTSDIGVDAETGGQGSVVFQVLADGNKVYDSGVMTGTTATKTVNVNLAGVKRLDLVVTNGGDNNDFDHADWAGARLTPASTTTTTAPAAPSNLAATAASSSQIKLTWTDNATNETGFKLERSTDGTTFTQIATPAAGATTYTDGSLSASTKYYYRLRATNSAGDSGYSSVANATTPAATTTSGSLFTANADIGSPSLAGSSSVANGVYTVKGSGADIWGTSDQFQFDSKAMTGDATLITRVSSLTNTNAWTKAGLMLRNGTAANAQFADILVTPGNGVSFQTRAATGGTSISTQVAGVTAPTWLKLTRSGNTFAGYYSSDGSTWKQVGAAQTITTGSTLQAGLAVTSHDNTKLATATFDNVSANSTVTPPVVVTAPAAPSSMAATAASSSQIKLTWTDNATNESGFKLQRSTDGTNFTQIATPAAGATSYTDSSLSASTKYYYRVCATNSAGDSAYSSVANATTQAATTTVTVPAAPSNLAATAASSSQIKLTWTDNASNESGFKLERSTDGTNFTQVATPAANTTSYTDSSLSASTKYYYRLRATNSAGDSAYTSVANATTQATSNPGTIVYSGPIDITQGGTYTGNWQSLNANTAAVTIDTSAPVTIINSNIQSKGIEIASGVSHVNLTVQNTSAIGLNPNVNGQAPGRFIDLEGFDNAVIKNNTLENTAGIYLQGYAGNKTASNTITVQGNKAHNIDGRHSNGSGFYTTDSSGGDNYDIVQFLQLDHCQNLTGMDVSWNQVVNDPNNSRVEDNINIYESSGTSASHMNIHDNYVQGGYAIDPANTSDYAGGGILAGDGPAGQSGYIDVHDNQVVSTTNYGVACSSGHDVNLYNNRVISSGLLPNGQKNPAQNVGAYIWNMYNAPGFSNNRGSGNLIGWQNGSSQNNSFTPNASSWSNNTDFPGTVTLATEASEFTSWNSKLASNGKRVGV